MVNEGEAAGASLEHTHAQLYALGFVPALIARERERFTAHNTRTMGGCLLCDLLQEEVRRRERVVAVDDDAVLLAPFASRAPYELQLVPRSHEPSFARRRRPARALLHDGARRACASARRAAAATTCGCARRRAAPSTSTGTSTSCRASPSSPGFELGTGVSVNIRAPERAAAELRERGASRASVPRRTLDGRRWS